MYSKRVFWAVMPRVENWASTCTSGSLGQNGGSFTLTVETVGGLSKDILLGNRHVGVTNVACSSAQNNSNVNDANDNLEWYTCIKVKVRVSPQVEDYLPSLSSGQNGVSTTDLRLLAPYMTVAQFYQQWCLEPNVLQVKGCMP